MRDERIIKGGKNMHIHEGKGKKNASRDQISTSILREEENILTW
jgi:hypothetical protein